MAATYTHADNRTILNSYGEFKGLAVVAVKAGDLCYQVASSGLGLATQVTTGSALTTAASCVACENIAAGARGTFALSAVVKAADTLSSTDRGAATEGSLATAGDEGEPLYLGTGGEATGTAPTPGETVIKQVVGYVTDDDTILLCPRSIVVPACS